MAKCKCGKKIRNNGNLKDRTFTDPNLLLKRFKQPLPIEQKTAQEVKDMTNSEKMKYMKDLLLVHHGMPVIGAIISKKLKDKIPEDLHNMVDVLSITFPIEKFIESQDIDV